MRNPSISYRLARMSVCLVCYVCSRENISRTKYSHNLYSANAPTDLTYSDYKRLKNRLTNTHSAGAAVVHSFHVRDAVENILAATVGTSPGSA